MDEESSLTIAEAFSVDELPINVRARSSADTAKDWPHLVDIRFEDIGESEVGLLIGCDTPEAHWVLDKRLGGRRQPFAVKTVLGWMLLGPKVSKKNLLSVNTTLSEETDIWSFLRRMYDTEFHDLGGVNKEISRNKRKAIDILERDTVYENGRYTVPLPWQETRQTLPDAMDYVRKRTQSLKKEV